MQLQSSSTYHLADPPIVTQGAILLLLSPLLHCIHAQFLELFLLMWIPAPMPPDMLHFIFNVIK